MINWENVLVLIRSNRLLLMPLNGADALEVLKWVNNPDIVGNFQFFTGKVDTENELRYIVRMQNSPTDLLFGLFIGGKELIGTCGLHEIDRNNDTARLGIIIGKQAHWNEGYAKEAIRALLDFAFNTINLHKVYLNVFVTNEKAIHLYRSVGFRWEGTLTKEYKIRKEYIDMYRMAILKEQWEGGRHDNESSD